MDSFVADLRRIDLLKVDVEGYEREVFRGGSEALRKTSCVLFEAWDQHFAKYGYGTPDVIGLLGDHGFSTFALRDGDLRPLPSDYRSQACENLVALRDSEAFTERWKGEGRSAGDGGRCTTSVRHGTPLRLDGSVNTGGSS